LSDGRIWTVDLTLTPEGSVLWDQAASKSFHAMVGIDLDGTVISAPLIQPSNTTFVSFGGQLQMSGNFTATQAKGIAAVLDNGTMPVTLKESATPGT
jgi:SecD/SecF fusion protein